MKKVVLFAFNGEMMCFVHVLLSAIDMKEKGIEVRVVLEGAATALIPSLASGESPFSGLYGKVKTAGLIDGACKACSAKMGVLEAVEKEGLPLLADMNGHPSMADYMADGYTVITF